jgi:cytochrome c oxidase subunit 2
VSEKSSKDPVVHVDRNFWIVTAVFAVLSVFGVIFWVQFPITKYLASAVVEADEIDQLFRFLAASGTVLFIFVIGYLVYFSIAFRRRSTDAPDAIGVQIHDNHRLELWWTVVPTIFVVVMAVFSVRIWYGIEENQAPNALTVEAIGHQWYYTFRLNGVHGEIPDSIHLPVSQPVKLLVTSIDVIHSFWVPAMRLKADMVPGAINTLNFTPKYPGTYKIICTEFCGTNHSIMDKQTVVIESQDAYDAWYNAWVAKTKNVSDALPKVSAGAIDLTGGDPAAGKAVFSATCSACHAVAPFAQTKVGPGLEGVLHDPGHPNLVDGDPATPDNVAKLLQNGFTGSIGTMPNASGNRLSNKDIANLVAYLDSLK